VFPGGEVSLVGIVQIAIVVGLGVLGDHLFGEFGIVARDLDLFDLALHEAAHLVGE
jgi:hypothetical protein